MFSCFQYTEEKLKNYGYLANFFWDENQYTEYSFLL